MKREKRVYCRELPGLTCKLSSTNVVFQSKLVLFSKSAGRRVNRIKALCSPSGDTIAKVNFITKATKQRRLAKGMVDLEELVRRGKMVSSQV